MGEEGTIARKTLLVKKVITETADTKSFVLECLDGKIEYKAGQFLTLIFTKITGEEARRSYSISSSPELNEPLTITVKRIPNGEYSRYMVDRVKAGDNLYTIGASGFFIVPEHIDKYRQIVFMAAGSGITPVYALIKTILHRELPTDILLIYSNTATTNSIFFRELTQLAENSRGRFQAEFLFSRSVDAHKSRLTPETLELFMQKHAITVAGNSLFFICGPTSYMRMLTYTLTTLGADQNRIKKEIFHVQHPTVRPKPPDTDPHTVTLIRNSEKKKFIAEYPVTILQAARLVNIHIPYSCETGQCGTCVAKCLQGKVWMAQNEVLLDEEMQKGSILTCTGYPVEGDVTIEIQ